MPIPKSPASAAKDRKRLLAALASIETALTENVDRSIEVRQRVQHFRTRLDAGDSVLELVEAEERPRTVEMLTHNMAILETVGSEFRINLAHALRSEGLTIDAIAALFGVTRQRISALLKQRLPGRRRSKVTAGR